MPIKFYLEKRTNLSHESAIRISWSFQGHRYQTTLGHSIKKENWNSVGKKVLAGTHNYNGVQAEDINRYIARIRMVVNKIEAYFYSTNNKLDASDLKKIISDTMSNNFHSELDIIDRWTINGPANDDSRLRFFRSLQGEYYRFVCNAFHKYHNEEYFILLELFGKGRRVVVSKSEFEKHKEPGSMWPIAKYEEVTEDEALGRIKTEKK